MLLPAQPPDLYPTDKIQMRNKFTVEMVAVYLFFTAILLLALLRTTIWFHLTRSKEELSAVLMWD